MSITPTVELPPLPQVGRVHFLRGMALLLSHITSPIHFDPMSTEQIFSQVFKYRLDKFKPISALQENPFCKHKRLKVFAQKGCTCVSCGVEGTVLARGIDKGGGRHWDVYTEDFYPLTVDHIVPKSKGGGDELSNLQPMCSRCNTKKGNTQ